MKSSKLVFMGVLFLVLGLFLEVSAQQEFMQTGVLFEHGTKIRIALAEVSNKRNGYTVGSNDMGLFQIRAKLGDTLLITKRGFNELEVVISSTKDLVLQLRRVNMLNEIEVTGKNKKQTMDEIRKDFKDKGSFYAGKPPLALLSPFGGSPLTFLYELFGRTPRNARRFDRYYQTELQQGQVDAFYNKMLINKYTGLEGKPLEDFMLSYRPDYQKTKNWTTYDGIKWIRDSYQKYTDSLKKLPADAHDQNPY